MTIVFKTLKGTSVCPHNNVTNCSSLQSYSHSRETRDIYTSGACAEKLLKQLSMISATVPGLRGANPLPPRSDDAARVPLEKRALSSIATNQLAVPALPKGRPYHLR